MKALDVILSNSTFCTNLVNKSSNEPHNRVGNVIVLRIFKPALCIIALSYTSCNTKKIKDRSHGQYSNATNDNCVSQFTEQLKLARNRKGFTQIHDFFIKDSGKT